MMVERLSHSFCLEIKALFLGVLLLAPALPASAAVQITELTKVSIEDGNLVIEGKRRRPGQTVVLDDGVAEAASNADRDFAFELVYLPPGCVVALKVGRIVKTAVVANCGPKGVNPQGPWTNTTRYQADDLVTFLGSSWRAKGESKNRRPDANPARKAQPGPPAKPARPERRGRRD